jgi:hypothetical protein
MSHFKFKHNWKDSDYAWDCDAVEYLLGQPEVIEKWKWSHAALFECLRCQPGRIKAHPERVKLAAQLAIKYGVEQVKTGSVVRLVRHDPDAPEYP